jgi:hypothetical protein
MPDSNTLERELRGQYPHPSVAATQRARAAVMEAAIEPARGRLGQSRQPGTTQRGRRRRWPLLVAAAAALALVAGLSYAFIPGLGGTSSTNPGDVVIPPVLLIPPNTTQIGSSVKIKAEATFANATLKIQVRRASFPPGADPKSFDPYSEQGQVVFTETVPMTNVPADAKFHRAATATWTGTLSVNDWTGGCQNNANYGIAVQMLNSQNSKDGETGGSQWFTCNPNS